MLRVRFRYTSADETVCDAHTFATLIEWETQGIPCCQPDATSIIVTEDSPRLTLALIAIKTPYTIEKPF